MNSQPLKPDSISEEKPSAAKRLPIKTKNLIRLLVSIIVVLAFLAGYYQTALKLEKKKYAQIEDKYVRVRQMLGRDKTQELIDQSYQVNN